jgi:hypothetical protein
VRSTIEEQQGQRRQHRQDVTWLLAHRQREERQRQRRPQQQPQVDRADVPPAPNPLRKRSQPHQGQRRPRQQAAGDDRKIEPPRPRVVEAIGREALEVVADEEALQVLVAMTEPHHDVPRHGHRHHDNDAQPDVAQRESDRAAFDHQHGNDDDQRDDQPYGSLGQEAQPERERGEEHELSWRPLLLERRDQRSPDRERNTEGQRQVRQGHAADREVAKICGDNCPGEQSRGFVVPAPPRGGRHQHQAQARHGRPKARGHLALPQGE